MELHPQDAKKLGINDGDPVKVASRRGSISLRTLVTNKTNPGVVFIPFFYAQAAANVLTNNVLDPLAKIPEYKVCTVKVEKISLEGLSDQNLYSPRGRY